MGYTRKELAKSLTNKTSNITRASITIAFVLVILPICAVILFVNISYALYFILLLAFVPSLVNKLLDVVFGRVECTEFLVLGNISVEQAQSYVLESKIICPAKYKLFSLSDFFLEGRTIYKNKRLNTCLVKINGARLGKSKVVVDIFDFTLMDGNRMDIFRKICSDIYTQSPYKNKEMAIEDYKRYLEQVAQLYPNTKMKHVFVSKYTTYDRIENLELNLCENPDIFLKFVLGADYHMPTFHKVNLQGEVLGEASLTPAEFAKLVYYDLLEAQKYSITLLQNSGYWDRM